MLLYHLADLHLGKRLNEYSLLEDQRSLLEQIASDAREERPDAIVIAGDLFDRPVPPEEAVRAFEEFIETLTSMDIPVLAVSGNHDSGTRIAQYSKLLHAAGFYIEGNSTRPGRKIRLQLGGETVDFTLIPYVYPAQIKRLYPEEEIKSYHDAYHVLLSHLPLSPDAVNILVAHQFFQGTGEAARSDSERMIIGGLEKIGADLLDEYDYAALGHLHRPQRAGTKKARYAGSLMKYSFSEQHDQKGYLKVRIEGGQTQVTQRILKPKHDLRELRGTVDELSVYPPSEDYIRAVLTDTQLPMNASVSLRSVFPNLMEVAFEPEREDETYSLDPSLIKSQKESPISLFYEFYKKNTGAEISPGQQKVLRTILKELEDPAE